MAGPKEEWLIWDRRFQFGYSCLNQRLKNNEEATQQIVQLDRKIEQLAASSKHLGEASDGLGDRIQKLEQAPCHIAQLDERIQDLTASSRTLKEENKALNDRILRLEQEGTRRDQEHRLVQEQLKEKQSAQEEDFRSVIVAMRGMHEIDRAEREQRGEEIQHLRSQVEALIATMHIPGGHTRDGESRGKRTMRTHVSNDSHSIEKSLSGHDRRRRPRPKYANQSARQAAAAQRRSPTYRGPRHAHKSSNSLHTVRRPPEVRGKSLQSTRSRGCAGIREQRERAIPDSVEAQAGGTRRVDLASSKGGGL